MSNSNFVQIGNKIYQEIDPKAVKTTKKRKKAKKGVSKVETYIFFVLIGLIIIVWAGQIIKDSWEQYPTGLNTNSITSKTNAK